MQVSYRTTVEDFVAFNRHLLWNTPFVQTVLWSAILLVDGIFFAVGIASCVMGNLESGVCLCLAAILTPIVCYKFNFFDAFAWFVRMYAERTNIRGMIGPTTLVVSPDSLVEITETTRSEIRLRDIHEIVETDTHLFIFVTGLSAAIVPRREFNTPAEYEAFRDFLMEHYRTQVR